MGRLDGSEGWRGKSIPSRGTSKGPKAGIILVYQRREGQCDWSRVSTGENEEMRLRGEGWMNDCAGTGEVL